MKLQPNKTYTITKKIKIHTKPLREVSVPHTGVFIKETAHSLIFRGFWVKKSVVVSIKAE